MYCSVCVYVFFFKQKTAYELRISDWSSDVCSSDLHIQALVIEQRHGDGRGTEQIDQREHCPIPAQAPCQQTGIGAKHGQHPEQDRKSVVEGKSVSVRVDLGGRRIIKTKNQTKLQLSNNVNKQTKERKEKKQS